MQNNSFLRFLLVFFFLVSNFFVLNAQEDIIKSYEDFTEAPREVVYSHLNKSTYIKGEILGFTSYVFDKFTKATSKQTTNLYCTISNEDGEVLKKKLIRVSDGIASNVFDIDSTLSTGIFTFKAYTNWMRNFEEHNHFEQTFKVIDADNKSVIKPIDKKDIIVDLQILGEGGHIIYDIPNTIGIIAKNQFGYGIANAFGKILDENENVISEFQLNDVGLAKVLLSPKSNTNYNVVLDLNGDTVSTPIKGIKQNGFNLTLKQTKDAVKVLLKANKNTNLNLQGKSFNVGLHNGNEIVLAPFIFNEDGTAILSFQKKDLFKGINIITIFNENNTPLLERLYFSLTDINHREIDNVSVSSKQDSLFFNLKINEKIDIKNSNISISILPSGTKSYNHHNSILSQIYIQPYINGFLENGGSYFKDKNRKTEYNLDLLMLTQGWSSYSWNTIFDKNERENIYPFERGIDVVANINDDKRGSYIVYPLAESKTQLFDVNESEDEFTIKQSFPTDDDLFRIGYIDTKRKEFKKKPSVYLQFYPSQFPDFSIPAKSIKETYSIDDTYLKNETNLNAFDLYNANKLEEVVINAKANTVETKVEKLREKAIVAKFRVIEDNVKLRGMRVDTYLQQLGYDTYYDIFSGRLSITNPRVFGKDSTPLVYLNSALLTTQGRFSEFGILTFITLDQVDYIEYETYGIGGGIRGAAGYIKIFTTPGGSTINKPNNVVDYKVPLVFSKNKTFYTPKYSYYNTDFFREYGTIDWQPNLKFNNQGESTFKYKSNSTGNITLFIEGFINDNEFISQEIKIERNN